MMPSRCCIQYGSTSGRPSSDHRAGKCQSSSQFPERVAIKNVLTIRQLHSFSMLIKSLLKSCMLDLSNMQELPDVQAGFREGRGTRDQIANIHWVIEKAREFQKKNLMLLFHHLWQSLWLCGSYRLWKALKEMGTSDHLTCLLRNLYGGQEAKFRTLYGTTN